jgi:hypothetical protein
MNVSGTRVYLYFSSLGLLLSLLTIIDSFGNNKFDVENINCKIYLISQFIIWLLLSIIYAFYYCFDETFFSQNTTNFFLVTDEDLEIPV